MRCIFSVFFAAVLVCAGGVSAGENAGPPAPVSTGIEVHGHWTIEVLDSDGKTVSITDFDNSLVSSLPLSHMLGLNGSQWGSYGGWMVRLLNYTVQPCGTQGCSIYQNSNICNSVLPADSTNLSVSEIEVTSTFYTIRLNGSVTATATTTIETVMTGVKVCKDNVVPSDCINENADCAFWYFTS
ncbi:MAG TPA: hypothetical protein PLV45_19375, partial [bacterium]|nr:hypothetical protein [bacterium]